MHNALSMIFGHFFIQKSLIFKKEGNAKIHRLLLPGLRGVRESSRPIGMGHAKVASGKLGNPFLVYFEMMTSSNWIF